VGFFLVNIGGLFIKGVVRNGGGGCCGGGGGG